MKPMAALLRYRRNIAFAIFAYAALQIERALGGSLPPALGEALLSNSFTLLMTVAAVLLGVEGYEHVAEKKIETEYGDKRP